jgi:hypothetical protein
VAVAAGAALHWLIQWDIEAETSGLYHARGDIGLLLGLRMAVLTVMLSFLLLTREMLPFSLVPALTIFGLVGGGGRAAVATYCFLIFLSAGLAGVGQAMLLVGLPEAPGSPRRPRPRPGQPAPGAEPYRSAEIRSSHPHWRRRHWIALGALIAAVMSLAYLLFIPIVAYATQYRFRLMMPMTSGGLGGRGSFRPQSGAYSGFPVGRGPTSPTDAPVLTIQGPLSGFWRGEVFDHYTGNAWVRSAAALWDGDRGEPRPRNTVGIQPSSLLGRRTVDLGGLLPDGGDVVAVTHIVRAETYQPFVLYSAGQIKQVAIIGPDGMRSRSREGAASAGDTLPRPTSVDRNGCISAPGVLMPEGMTYRVVSIPLEMRPRGPSSAGSRQRPPEVGLPILTPADPQLYEAYMSVPFSARRVADLARQVVGQAATPSDKLTALVAFLQQNYSYTLNAPAVPLGEDAADYFLFRQKRGYCDLFATSLALMARAVGIPARVATGYAGGERDPAPVAMSDLSPLALEKREAKARSDLHGDRWIIREADAHAWVEVYLPAWGGWVSVDATPAGELSTVPPARRALLATRFFLQDHAKPAAALAGVILGAAVVALLLIRRRADRALRARARMDPRAAVVWAYVQLCQLLHRRGNVRRPSQTPLEFLASLESAQTASKQRPQALRRRPASPPPDILAPVRALTDLFLAARYSPSPVSQDTAAVAAQHLAEFRRASRRRPWRSRHP